MGRFAVGLLLILALSATPAVAGMAENRSTTNETNQGEATIESVYPNPIADDDAGEYVAVRIPASNQPRQYALADNEASAPLRVGNASGRLVFSTAPNQTAEVVDAPVRPLSTLELSNSGEPLQLLANDSVVDTLHYTNAPEGDVRVAGDTDHWLPLGATNFTVVTAGAGRVRTFVLPDSPAVAVDHLRGADRRILLAGYTLTSKRVADELIAATERNVSVTVLVDGDPVGGFPRRQAELLDRVSDAGIEVRVVGSEHARYDFHHPKYAVADGTALVTTEKWKPAGIGGTSSRGWGVVTKQDRIVTGLVDTFEADSEGIGVVSWATYRPQASVTATNATIGSYPQGFEPSTVKVNQTQLLVAPDNAERAIVASIENATDSVSVEQVSIGSRQSPFLQAALDAARQGVRVRLLLSSAWYARDDNRQLVNWLNDRAATQNIPLQARLIEPGGNFEKIHAKGVVIDSDEVILGSLNWNNNSARENREVVVVLEGEEAGAYFQRVFDADWPAHSLLPIGHLIVIALVAAGVVVVVRRLRFADSDTGISASADNCLTKD